MDPHANSKHRLTKAKKKTRRPVEIAVIGEVDDWESDIVEKLLETRPGGECVFYIDSTGGSVYGALAVVTLLRERRMKSRAMVLGECSSAALLLFAACQHRVVTSHSTLLFHKMRWQSDRRVDSSEAVNWAQHFATLEKEMDDLQIRLFGQGGDKVREWTEKGCFVSGPQIVAAGLAELLEL
jgi:ATP-dependent Clp protease, protease subunit